MLDYYIYFILYFGVFDTTGTSHLKKCVTIEEGAFTVRPSSTRSHIETVSWLLTTKQVPRNAGSGVSGLLSG